MGPQELVFPELWFPPQPWEPAGPSPNSRGRTQATSVYIMPQMQRQPPTGGALPPPWPGCVVGPGTPSHVPVSASCTADTCCKYLPRSMRMKHQLTLRTLCLLLSSSHSSRAPSLTSALPIRPYTYRPTDCPPQPQLLQQPQNVTSPLTN